MYFLIATHYYIVGKFIRSVIYIDQAVLLQNVIFFRSILFHWYLFPGFNLKISALICKYIHSKSEHCNVVPPDQSVVDIFGMFMLDRRTTRTKFDLTWVQTHDLWIMMSTFDIPETLQMVSFKNRM